jgi:hypothetical protein
MVVTTIIVALVRLKQSILSAVTELILRSDPVTYELAILVMPYIELQNQNQNQRRRTKEKMNEKEQYEGRRKQFLHHLPCLNDTRYVSNLLKK